MSALEELLYQRLTDDQNLSGLLASYDGMPAVFELMAPRDSDPGWSGNQTPRMEFVVSRQEDPERRVSGQVTITILHRWESFAAVAEIETRVRSLLDGATFRSDEGTVSLRWNRAEPFDQDPDYRGLEVVYDLIAWPSGLTYSPDPVQAFRNWATQRWPDLQVDPETWSPTDASPALYLRFAAIEGEERLQWGSWITGRFQGHILAPSPSVRVEWIRRVTEGLALDRRLNLGDGSRIFIQRLQADSEADPFRTGQIRIQAQFGVLIPEVDQTPLNKAYIDGDAKGGVIANG